VAEAKAHLSEILRLARSEGPQRIGTRRSFVVVPADEWDSKANPRKPLGRWLIENMSRGMDLEVPERRSARAVPFSGEDDG
jgi:prevent-host-death family protein